ncbi:MAG: L(+)-tartrate dehydratase subunit alpha [Christensenellales bacterium]|jgi:L(+)-tartrate dehydratase alpha subunit
MADIQAKKRFIDAMVQVMDFTCRILPDDVCDKLRELQAAEKSDMQRVIYGAYFSNLEKAKELKRPCCQDTGILHFYISAGTEFPHLGMVEEALNIAVKQASAQIPLRQNTINYFEERNTGDDTGERIPWVHWDLIPGSDELEIITYFAGGGCCLPGRSKMYKPSDGYKAIVDNVFDAVADLGINACPPLVVGVGLGHNIENAAVLSKKAYLRPLGAHHPHPKGAQFERDLTKALNCLGIGAQGLRGEHSVMAVHVESSGRHTATIAVAVSVACYAHRRSLVRFHPDLSFEVLSHREAIT